MEDKRWTEKEILRLSTDRDSVLDRLLASLSKKGGIVFAAKLGFGIPRIDLATVDDYRTITGYVLKLPVVHGEMSTMPYFQGFGEAIFLPDQMFDESFLIVPDMEAGEYSPFTYSPHPRFRLRKMSYEAGVCLFDKDFNVKIFREPKGSLAKHYWRLKLELFDSIHKFGKIKFAEGKEEEYGNWEKWLDGELASLGSKWLLDKGTATELVKRILNEKNYHAIKMELKEEEVPAEPRPIPVYAVKGTGLYLGDEKGFYLKLSRVSGMILSGNY